MEFDHHRRRWCRSNVENDQHCIFSFVSIKENRTVFSMKYRVSQRATSEYRRHTNDSQ